MWTLYQIVIIEALNNLKVLAPNWMQQQESSLNLKNIPELLWEEKDSILSHQGRV